MGRIFTSSRYSVVTSTLALVVALSGTAYAVATVTSADIVNNTVQGLDIKANTVASSDIKNGTVTGTDIANGNILGEDLADGTVANADLASPIRWALVDLNGSVQNSFGVTGAVAESAGTYTVTFDVSVANCALTATPIGNFTDSIVIADRSGTARVEISNDAGTLTNAGFSLTAFC